MNLSICIFGSKRFMNVSYDRTSFTLNPWLRLSLATSVIYVFHSGGSKTFRDKDGGGYPLMNSAIAIFHRQLESSKTNSLKSILQLLSKKSRIRSQLGACHESSGASWSGFVPDWIIETQMGEWLILIIFYHEPKKVCQIKPRDHRQAMQYSRKTEKLTTCLKNLNR